MSALKCRDLSYCHTVMAAGILVDVTVGVTDIS